VKVIETEIPGVLIIEPDVYRDERGFFLETFRDSRYAEVGVAGPFVQDNHSKSCRNTLRGLHAQCEHSQGKLVWVTNGEVFDVAVDIRKGSPTFGKWVGSTLSADTFRQMYIPPGFAHGFCVMSETAQFVYKCTDYYCKEDEITVLWNDPDIGIEWPLSDPILSEKDRTAPRLSELTDRLPDYPTLT